MYINTTGYYIPNGRVYNDHFLNVNGLTSDWILKRTGIFSRSKAAENEGHNSMGLNAIADAVAKLSYDIKEVDLIVSASYSPYDTVATLAHITQQKYDIPNMKAVYASAACSSFVNGLEIIEGYFAMGKAKKHYWCVLSIIHTTAMKVIQNVVTCGVMAQLLFSYQQSAKMRMTPRLSRYTLEGWVM